MAGWGHNPWGASPWGDYAAPSAILAIPLAIQYLTSTNILSLLFCPQTSAGNLLTMLSCAEAAIAMQSQTIAPFYKVPQVSAGEVLFE